MAEQDTYGNGEQIFSGLGCFSAIVGGVGMILGGSAVYQEFQNNPGVIANHDGFIIYLIGIVAPSIVAEVSGLYAFFRYRKRRE